MQDKFKGVVGPAGAGKSSHINPEQRLTGRSAERGPAGLAMGLANRLGETQS